MTCRRLLPFAAIAAMSVGCSITSSDDSLSKENAESTHQHLDLPPSIKAASHAFSTLASYYSTAKTAYDVLTTIGQVLGILDKPDPNAQFEAVEKTVQDSAFAVDWHGTMEFIDATRGPAVWAIGRLEQTGGVIAEGSLEDQDSGSAAQTIAGGSAFLRANDPAATDGTDVYNGKGFWKWIVTDTPDVNNGLVYDWRLGAPALLELIAYRLHIIAAMDHNFRWDRRYDESDLIPLRAALQTQYGNMVAGIRCKLDGGQEGGPLGLGWACADINTGAFAYQQLVANAPSDDAIFARLRAIVEESMPLFEMKSMIDTLTLYLSGASDTMADARRLRAGNASDLCVGGTPSFLAMEPCKNNEAQAWVYNRTGATISKPDGSGCLAVAGGDGPGQSGVQATAPTVLLAQAVCDGSSSQMWTYAPDTQVMQNGQGTVLSWVAFPGLLPFWPAMTFPLIAQPGSGVTWLPSRMHGFMIMSDEPGSMAVRPSGAPAEGAPLVMTDQCTVADPACTWSYWRGMLLNDADPSLAVNAYGGAHELDTLVLTRACTQSNPDCTWTYRAGEFLSDRDWSFAMNSYGGAYAGAPVLLTQNCDPNTSTCTWDLPDLMFTSERDATLGVNALGGAVNPSPLALHNACTADNPDCTWTFHAGMLISSRDGSLAINAWGGARDLGPLQVNNLCTADNPDCTWTWSQGELISDNQANGWFPVNAYGGAVHLAPLLLNQSCDSSNPDCLFSGFFAAGQ